MEFQYYDKTSSKSFGKIAIKLIKEQLELMSSNFWNVIPEQKSSLTIWLLILQIQIHLIFSKYAMMISQRIINCDFILVVNIIDLESKFKIHQQRPNPLQTNLKFDILQYLLKLILILIIFLKYLQSQSQIKLISKQVSFLMKQLDIIFQFEISEQNEEALYTRNSQQLSYVYLLQQLNFSKFL